MNQDWFTDPPEAITGEADRAYRDCMDSLMSTLDESDDSDLRNNGIQVFIGNSTTLIDLLHEGEAHPNLAVFSANGLIGTVKFSDDDTRIFCCTKGRRIDDLEAATLINKPSPHPILVSCLRAQQREIADDTYNLLNSISGLWALDMNEVDQVINDWTESYGWYCRWGRCHAGDIQRRNILLDLDISSPLIANGNCYYKLYWSDCTTLTSLVMTGERFKDMMTLSSNGRLGTLYNHQGPLMQFVRVARDSVAHLISEEEAILLIKEDADWPAIFENRNSFSSRTLQFAFALTRISRTYPVRELVDELWRGSSSWKQTFNDLVNPRYMKSRSSR